MKTYLLIWLLPVFVILSCREKKPPPTKPVPTVLEGKSIDVASLLKKGRSTDLVDALYEELMAKSDTLQQLDAAIRQLSEQQKQASDSFRIFDQKNKVYYQAADNKLPAIRDSLLRKKLMQILRESRQRYNKRTAPYIVLDSLIAYRSATISDLYLLLKVMKTLPVIEQYQQDHLPGSAPAEVFHTHLDSLWRRLDSLTQTAPASQPH